MFSEGRDEDPDRTEATIEVGQWVLVEYDGDLFPGTVTQVNLISRFLLMCEYFSVTLQYSTCCPAKMCRDYINVS